MPRQFAACKFRDTDKRSYTYHWDGEPLKPRDVVKVADRSGDGWVRATVVFVTDRAPEYATKPILGKVDPDPPKELPLDDEPMGFNPHSGAEYDGLDN